MSLFGKFIQYGTLGLVDLDAHDKKIEREKLELEREKLRIEREKLEIQRKNYEKF